MGFAFLSLGGIMKRITVMSFIVLALGTIGCAGKKSKKEPKSPQVVTAAMASHSA